MGAAHSFGQPAWRRTVNQYESFVHTSLEHIAPGRHELHVFPGYGHQDPFMGKDMAQGIFPRLGTFLDEHRDGSKRQRLHAASGKTSGRVVGA